ncbi:MAG: hypothetical protein HC831_04170 [Chloroflexia bacterium]|nr:hypothetical protein [Chloroflexia bacterium]
MNILANNGASIVQLSEFELWTSGSTPTGVATVYQHTNYGGYAVGLGVGNYSQSALAGLGVSNNDLSSIKVTNGYKVTLFDGDNFTGESLVKTADDATLVDDGWNDRATSMKVEQAGNNAVATVYQHTNYGGYAVGLSVGNYSLAALQSLGISDNDLSSVKVSSGYKITLYDSDNFSGSSLVKTSDDATLVDDGWNDKALQ